MMNAMILLTAMTVGASYNAEDFHYYDKALQSRGLPIVNKLYVEVPQKDKKEFFEVIEKLKIERFKEFQSGYLNGILLFCENKKATFETLNILAEKKYRVFPVVIFDGIECTTTGDIAVTAQPSVSLEAFTKRLDSVADGKFKIQKIEDRSRTYLVTVEELNNPSNVLVLANLIAKDNFWCRHAMIAWQPIDGWVKANIVVETPAISSLGELRSFKIVVDVFDPDIVVRTDLLPVLGQSLQPFPYAGEIWFDPSPPKITEARTNKGKTVTAEYAFRQLQFGNFMFQPIVISYEKDGQLQTIRTSNCSYIIRSVIAGTDIDDIQPRPTESLELMILRPVGFPKRDNPMKDVYRYAKIMGSVFFFSIAAGLFLGALIQGKQRLRAWMTPDEEKRLWADLTAFWQLGPYGPGPALATQYYKNVADRLNKVMLGVFGVSLYSVKLEECTENFKNLVNELDKIYQPAPFFNAESLNDFVKAFCRDGDYK